MEDAHASSLNQKVESRNPMIVILSTAPSDNLVLLKRNRKDEAIRTNNSGFAYNSIFKKFIA
jgi:hypothetical protein